MIDTNLAIDIANLQADLCDGAMERQELLERLSVIKNKSLGIKGMVSEKPIDAIVEGYRMDAIEQLHELLAMASETIEAGSIPPMKLVHVSCCAELLTAKVMHYFKVRNDAATREMLNKFAEANHG